MSGVSPAPSGAAPEGLLRPLLLTIILRLRPELDTTAVEEAVTRMLSRLEASGDPRLVWNEVDEALTALIPSPQLHREG